MAILPSSGSRKPILVQPVTSVENPMPTADLFGATGINWSSPNSENIPPASRSTDLNADARALGASIQADLNKLRQLHQVLLEVEHFGEDYKAKNKLKGEDYAELSTQVRTITTQDASLKEYEELQKIANVISLDRTYIDCLFPQIKHDAKFIVFLMTNVVNEIGFDLLRKKANLALQRLTALCLEVKSQFNNPNEIIHLPQALHIILTFNEMRKYEAIIKKIAEENDSDAHNIRKSVLIGILVTFIILVATLITLYNMDYKWQDIRDYLVLGIPMGILVWSFLGSFAAMLSQFYQKEVYLFGNTLKWVVIRPVLGVVMGAAIYLALQSLGMISTVNSNHLLPLLIAFFIGYSDTFTFDILNTIQRTITGMFNPNKSDDAVQPVYIVPAATVETAPPATTKPLDKDIPLRPSNLPDLNAGEDE